jgi:hypothetical protein
MNIVDCLQLTKRAVEATPFTIWSRAEEVRVCPEWAGTTWQQY